MSYWFHKRCTNVYKQELHILRDASLSRYYFIVCLNKVPQKAWFSPGNRIISAGRPLCCNACTSVWHCVVFPALSTPSRTIKAPLLQDMALENNWKCGTVGRKCWHWLANQSKAVISLRGSFQKKHPKRRPSPSSSSSLGLSAACIH